MDLVVLGWIFAIQRLTRLSYTVRVMNFLALGVVLGIGLLLTVGPISLNYLMAPPVLAVILLGTRPALILLGLGSTSILVLGLTGQVPMHVATLEHDPVLATLVTTLNFACIGALVTLTSGTLLKGLSRSLGEARGTANALEAGQAELHAANAELRLTSTALARLNDLVIIAKVDPAQGAPLGLHARQDDRAQPAHAARRRHRSGHRPPSGRRDAPQRTGARGSDQLH